MRPGTGVLYQAARARTIPDKNQEVKRYLAIFGPDKKGQTTFFVDDFNMVVNSAEKRGLSPIAKIPDSPCGASGMTTGSVSGGCRKRSLLSIQLDLDVDASCQIELHQRIDSFVGRIDDIHQALVRPDLVLISRILVHMG